MTNNLRIILGGGALTVCFSIYSLTAVGAPKFSSCTSDDQMVAVELIAQSEDESAMIDVQIKSKDKNRPAEVSIPTQEQITDEHAIYTLLDSGIEILKVELATGKGQLSNGQFGGPNPFINVSCVQ